MLNITHTQYTHVTCILLCVFASDSTVTNWPCVCYKCYYCIIIVLGTVLLVAWVLIHCIRHCASSSLGTDCIIIVLGTVLLVASVLIHCIRHCASSSLGTDCC